MSKEGTLSTIDEEKGILYFAKKFPLQSHCLIFMPLVEGYKVETLKMVYE